MNILVTGGAGYIGSHVVKLLGDDTDHSITVVDNLSTGRRESVLYGNLIEADLSDFSRMDEIFREGNFDAVIHFAAFIVVPESVRFPVKYYMNNTVNTTNLVNLCLKYNVGKFIFSSTASVYGETETGVVNETTPTAPINPYGMSKLMSERVLIDASYANENFNYAILRYFNVAGADPDGKIGQCFPNATHLIKVACEAALGKRESLSIFGADFPTEDGTGVRDYIHVTDLASAHVEALNYLEKEKESNIFNCGYGNGFSVKQVLAAVKEVSGTDFKIEVTERREGDPAKVVADNGKILSMTGWKPELDDLRFIVKTALEWEKKLSV